MPRVAFALKVAWGCAQYQPSLYEFRMGASEGDAADYAEEFSVWVRQAVLDGDTTRLAQALQLAPHADRAHPTTEHFLPLLVAAGAASTPNPMTVLNGGIRHGVLAMESYVFGRQQQASPGDGSDFLSL